MQLTVEFLDIGKLAGAAAFSFALPEICLQK
ncbi:hypothetical protein BO443_20289 [Burkholderia orbicola]